MKRSATVSTDVLPTSLFCCLLWFQPQTSLDHVKLPSCCNVSCLTLAFIEMFVHGTTSNSVGMQKSGRGVLGEGSKPQFPRRLWWKPVETVSAETCLPAFLGSRSFPFSFTESACHPIIKPTTNRPRSRSELRLLADPRHRETMMHSEMQVSAQMDHDSVPTPARRTAAHVFEVRGPALQNSQCKRPWRGCTPLRFWCTEATRSTKRRKGSTIFGLRFILA